VEGDTATAFERCTAEVSAAIRRNPAHWDCWNSPVALANLGLIRPQQDRPPPVFPPDGKFQPDELADGVPARD
jgi:hypothetical protein